MANSYAIGTLVRMTATFQLAGVNADPGTVTAQVKDPAGVISSPAVVKDATGVYHADFTIVLAGVHYYHFIGATGLTVAAEGAFVALLGNF